MNNEFEKLMQFTDGLIYVLICITGKSLGLSSFGLLQSIVALTVGVIFVFYCKIKIIKKMEDDMAQITFEQIKVLLEPINNKLVQETLINKLERLDKKIDNFCQTDSFKFAITTSMTNVLNEKY